MIHLLITEDDDAHRELIESALRKLQPNPYTWTFAESLAETAAVLRETQFDLVLLDLSLPDSPYHETLGRTLEFAGDTPVIVLTSLDDRQTVLNMIQQGAKDCIPKTLLNPLFLERSITYCLDRERILRENLERERRLEQTVSFLRLFNRSKIGFIICDREATIIEANPAFADWLGYDQSELIGMRVESLTCEEHRQESFEAVKSVQLRPEEEVSMTKKYLRRDGGFVWGNVTVQSIQWLDQTDCLLASVFDLTAEIVAQDRLKAAIASKNGVISMISHDVRAPLANIIALSDLLADSSLPEEDSQCVTRIRQSAHIMLEIVDHILEFSRAEQGQIDLSPALCDLPSLLESSTGLFQEAVRDKNLRLSTTIADPCPEPVVDEGRLRQILVNLLSNAIKFTPEGGSVDLIATAEGDTFSIQVRDSGMGIAPADQSRLFKPFSQANPQVHKRFGGTGLGLFLCKQLAERMGGSISLQSQPGNGSTFTVSLPMISEANS